jgi:predicted TPR repeat methyltransferase
MRTSAEIRQFFDSWKMYDRDMLSQGYYIPDLLVNKTLPFLSSGESILDVGCGTGLVGVALRRARWSGHITGIDLAAQRLGQADRKKVYDRLLLGNAYALPHFEKPFDVVISSALLGLAGPQALRQMWRHVRPGGILSASVGKATSLPATEDHFNRVVAKIYQLRHSRILAMHSLGYGYAHQYTDEQYQQYIVLKKA